MDKIDHIGIAVNSLAEAVPLWTALLGENPSGEEEVPGEGVRVAFFGRGPARIELLESTREDSAIARHLSRRGPGIHHICLAVDDVAAALARAREAGLDPVPPGVREGAGGRAVVFLHPRSAGGVLVELSGPTSAEASP